MADTLRSRLGARAETLEAMALLALARLLIAFVPLRKWRGWLGAICAMPTGRGGCEAEDHRLAQVVGRGAMRAPFPTKCLPRAMALHWMLRRRRRSGQLAIAVLPGSRRGSLDDLHAWVERGGEVLIGVTDQPYAVLARFE